MRWLPLLLILTSCTATRIDGDCTLKQEVSIEYRCAQGGHIGNVRSVPPLAP